MKTALEKKADLEAQAKLGWMLAAGPEWANIPVGTKAGMADALKAVIADEPLFDCWLWLNTALTKGDMTSYRNAVLSTIKSMMELDRLGD